jgi:hypothetical protein
MSRPSLRITRHDDQDPPEQIVFEVWNPLAGVYEPMDTLDTGLFRLAELVEQVRVMRVRHDPRRESLKKAPDPAEGLAAVGSGGAGLAAVGSGAAGLAAVGSWVAGLAVPGAVFAISRATPACLTFSAASRLSLS